jgi:hypothetical protein
MAPRRFSERERSSPAWRRDCYVGVAALGVPPPVEISAQRMALDDSADPLGPLQLLARTA